MSVFRRRVVSSVGTAGKINWLEPVFRGAKFKGKRTQPTPHAVPVLCIEETALVFPGGI